MLSQNTRILLIEDDDEDALLLRKSLQQHRDFSRITDLFHVHSIKEAKSWLNTHPVDVIVSDLGLGESQGIETVRELYESFSLYPIVVLSGLEYDDLRKQAGQIGIQDYLIKRNLDGDSLIRAMAYAIERKRAELRYRHIFQYSNDGILLLDFSGHVLEMNHKALSLFAMGPVLAGGLEIEALLPKEQREQWAKYQEQMLVQKAAQFEISFLKKEGEQFIGDVSASLIDTTSKPIIQCLIRDISERRKLEKMKDDLISTVSHEIRTPLTIIKSAVDVIKTEMAGPVSEQQTKLLHMASLNADRLARIVNDTLDLARLESGRAAVQKERFDVNAAIEETVRNFEKEAACHGILLKTEFSRQSFAFSDKDLAVQILNNLIGNALRYAASAVAIKTVELPDHVEISVIDDGIGISSSDQTRLFNKFEQIDRPQGGSGYKGTGLGLALCKEIISHLHGKIGVISAPQKGACFYFTLPRG